MESITLKQPDDWHLHLRDGDVLRDVVPDTAHRFSRAIIMPNLDPPVVTTRQALQYRQRILDAIPDNTDFNPLMTLYLTDNTDPDEIEEARDSGHVYAVKYYPAGATTNSDQGVTSIDNTYDVLEKLAETGMPLLVHGEVTDRGVDIFDREKIFIDYVLQPLINRLPELKIVFEHITTEDAVSFVNDSADNIAATITPHHLLYNRNALFNKGIRPHYYCLPILKREQHRKVLVDAATSGAEKFFLGTDSAPHPVTKKESGCGCAGIYNSHAAIELYAEIFEWADSLDTLERFASINGPTFYGLPVNQKTITLVKEEWEVPLEKPFATEKLVPLRAGESISWKLAD